MPDPRQQLISTLGAVAALDRGEARFFVHAARQDAHDWLTRDQALGRLDDLFARFPPGEGASPEQAQGQLLLEAWAWTVLAPACAALLLDGTVIDLAAASLQVHVPDGFKPVQLAVDPDAAWAAQPRRATPGDPAGIDLLLGAMIAHHQPWIDAIAARTARPKTALWRGVRDRLAGALQWAGEGTGQDALAQAMLRHAFEGRVRGPVPVVIPDPAGAGKGELQRAGCCLWWRTGQAPCLTCPRSRSVATS